MTAEFPPPDARLDGKVKIEQLGKGDCRVAEKDSSGEAFSGPSWSRNAFTAAQLQKMKFPPISWIVPNIIPAEGVTLLCSKPKFGKSWLAYDLCIACTMDRVTLGTIKPAQGDVLYLALEDSKRRLQRRMTKLLPSFGATWPERLTLKTEWRRLHEGGLDDIRDWQKDTKREGGKPILVTIDVLAKVRKPVGNSQLYEADYAALADLTKLANELGLAIVVVHHTRKMAADDLMETVSGSYGISGAVDTILVMGTKGSGTVLDIRGRDVESAEFAIEFNKATCRWRVLGDAAEVHRSEQRAKIIAALKDGLEPMTITALMEATHMKRNPLEVLLGRMVQNDEIRRFGKGLYAHKDYTPPPNDDLPGRDTLGSGRKSVASVQSSRRPTDCQTENSSAQIPERKRRKAGICPSVASVRENTDIGLARHVANVASVPAQTDRTGGQMDPENVDTPAEIDAADLSRHLSRVDGQTDRGFIAAAVKNPATDDFPDLPEFLRRVPIAVAPKAT